MTAEVIVPFKALVTIAPGDECVLIGTKPKKTVFVRCVVENSTHKYAVFSDGRWRPMSSYGKTWKHKK